VTLAGFSVSEKIASPEERNVLLASLGCIQDGIQDCLDDIQCHLGLPPLFNFQPQIDAFASHIQEKFYARCLCNEWLTIQVKCLTRRDKTQTHLDKSNCTWKGCSSTAALCFIGVDSFDVLWSMKFIVNSRSNIGNYFPETIQMFSKTTDIVVASMIQKNKRRFCGKPVSVVFRLPSTGIRIKE
jgi:hypothetical protein